MNSDRRDFLETLAIGALGASAAGMLPSSKLMAQAAGHWDLTWTNRIKGKRRAVFDVHEIEDGYGIWRAIIWKKQYAQMFGIAESSLTPVVVVRHNAVPLALNQEYWDRYKVGEENKVNDPATRQPTKRNPVCAREGKNELPAQFGDFTIENLISGGGIVLLCALAFRDAVETVAREDKLSVEEADKKARSMIIKGVTMQPSGIFAVSLAQENGCSYVLGS